MKIDVNREARCFQDDQLGPLGQAFQVPDTCTVGELLGAIVASRFLQFSVTHTTMRCRIDPGPKPCCKRVSRGRRVRLRRGLKMEA